SCYIGLTTAGVAAPNAGNGVFVNGSSGNTIGSTSAGSGNVISGNSGNGVLISAGSSGNTVARNFIGTNAAGTAALGNTLDGVKLLNSDNNLIGNNDPITSITYNNTDQVSTQPVSELTGIRGADTAGQYLISGISGALNVAQGLLIEGTIQGVGSSFLV